MNHGAGWKQIVLVRDMMMRMWLGVEDAHYVLRVVHVGLIIQ